MHKHLFIVGLNLAPQFSICYNICGDDMGILEVVIDGKKYEYVDSMMYEGKCYVALANDENITINEYAIEGDYINLFPLDDNLFQRVKEAMNL